MANHEAAVEAESEVADYGVCVIFILVKEVVRPGKRYLVNVFVDFLCGHADASVGDGDGSLVLVNADPDGEVAQLAGIVALARQCTEFLRGVAGVAHNLADENLVVAVEKLFDYGEDVLGCNPDVSCLHVC